MYIGSTFVYALLCKYGRSQLQQKGLYYVPPEWPINDPSITVGTVRTYLDGKDSILSFATSATLAAFCQINLINKGLAGPKIKGDLNFKVYDCELPQQNTQYFVLKLLENSLYNMSTKQPLIPGNDSEKLGVLFHSQAIGNVRAGYGVIDFFGIPYLDYGTVGLNGYENSVLQTRRFSNTVLYSLRLTQNFTIASAVFEVLNFYNWTLVASLFEQTSFGSYMLSIVQSLPVQSSNISFVCNRQTSPNRLAKGNPFIPNFCSCVKKFDEIQVIVLWGEFAFADHVASSIKSQCSGFDNILFLIADDSDILYPLTNYPFSLENALWINSDGLNRFEQFLRNCTESLASEEQELVLQGLIDTYFLLEKGCYYFQPKAKADLKCNNANFLQEFKNDTVTNEFFYAADAITAIAEGVNLLQNNCSFLNEEFKNFLEIVPELTDVLLESIGVSPSIDFCAIETFTPAILSVVTRFVSFIGYTGKVSFDYRTLFRRRKPYFIFNFRNSFFDNERVGLITEETFYLNTSLIIFPNNNSTPTSAIVPDNSNLGVAVVDVFFGIFIFFAFAFTVILFVYIYLRKEPRIRKNSPLLSYILLLGCILVTAGLIIASINTNDGICIVSRYFSYNGQALLFGSLVAKNYRIYRIFHNANAAPVLVPEWKLILGIGLYWLYFMFLVSMLLVAGFGSYLGVSRTNPFYTYLSCRCSSSFWNTFFLIVFTLSKITAIVAAAILAFVNRKIPAAYSESRQISIIVYTLLSFGIVLTPIYFVMGDNTNSQIFKFLIQAVFVTITVVTISCVLFLPNLYQVYHDRQVLRQRDE